MAGSYAYEDDIYAWSMEQAALLRDLAHTPGLPPNLDIDHLADEVEDVGKTELYRAESFVRLILLHLLKVASAPRARPADHWRAEIRAFHLDLRRAMSRSISRKIDLQILWRVTCDQAKAQLQLRGDTILPGLPTACPLALDDLVTESIDVDDLAAKIRAVAI